LRNRLAAVVGLVDDRALEGDVVRERGDDRARVERLDGFLEGLR
jgi:hypothetical protein